jgi:hypothetical protein
MSIPEYVRANFNTLLRATAAGGLALLDCAGDVTGERHAMFLAQLPRITLTTR